MAPLLSLFLTAFLASLVAAEDLASCGSSNYYPSQVSVLYIESVCCSNNTLEPINKNGPETLEACGGSMFYPSQAIRLPRREFPLSFHEWGSDLEYMCAAYYLPPSNYTTDERPVAPTTNCPPLPLPLVFRISAPASFATIKAVSNYPAVRV
ncbi:hypothetical protein FB451DRAFT_1172291 [Mycena latifolia]|nr:hypothetical protein FB451DRAFT_1172291 [Mycena latifolia]